MNAAHTQPSQEARIFTHLQQGNALTQHEAQRLFGCARLASRISKLRQRGAPIMRRMIDAPARNGGTARVAEYFIPS